MPCTPELNQEAKKVRILITGASGYVAGALRAYFSDHNRYQLTLVTRHEGAIVPRKSEKISVQNLYDKDDWIALLHNTDIVIHLSALTNLKETEPDTDLSFRENVQPVMALIEAAQEIGKKDLKVIFSSTVTVIGNKHDLPADETIKEHPITNYDAHKVIAEQKLAEAHNAHILKACSLRLCNIYGGLKSVTSKNLNRGIMNFMIRQAYGGADLKVYGHGNYLRDFLHIDDLVSAFVSLIECDDAFDGGAYLCVTGEGHTIKDAFCLLADHASLYCKKKINVIHTIPEDSLHPIEERNFVGSFQKLKNVTGWVPKISLLAGIEKELRQLEHQ